MPDQNYEESLHQSYLDSFPSFYYPTPIQGIKSDVPETELVPFNRVVPLVLNFLPTNRGTLKKRQGYFEHISNQEIIDFFEWANQTGISRIVAVEKFSATQIKIRELKPDVNNNLENDSADPLTVVNPGAFPHFGIYGGSGVTRLYISLKGNRLIKFTRGESPVLTDALTDGIAVTEIKPEITLSAGGHLIIANTIETESGVTDPVKYPYRIRVSKFLFPENFDTAQTGAKAFRTDLLDDDVNGPILAIHPLREAFAVYKQNSIYNLANRGDGTFFTQMKCGDRGVVSGKAIAPVYDGNVHLLVSRDNIYLYDGFTLKFPPVGDAVRSFLYSKDDSRGRRLTTPKTVVVKSLPERDECWIFFDDKYENGRRALCWNWKRNSWTYHDLGADSIIHAQNTFPDPTAMNLASTDDTGDNSYIGVFGNKIVSLFRGTKDGRSSGGNGSVISAKIRYPLQSVVSKNKTPHLPFTSLDQDSYLEASAGTDFSYQLQGIFSNSMIRNPFMLEPVDGEELTGRRDSQGYITFPIREAEEGQNPQDLGEYVSPNSYRYIGAILTASGEGLEEIGDLILKTGKK